MEQGFFEQLKRNFINLRKILQILKGPEKWGWNKVVYHRQVHTLQTSNGYTTPITKKKKKEERCYKEVELEKNIKENLAQEAILVES